MIQMIVEIKQATHNVYLILDMKDLKDITSLEIIEVHSKSLY
jgi:hypothetical protein